ncbi:hypothetical protein [Persicobacter psychrovividus]|uniref:YgjV family protein n=1 Tax=Persicobacter psychrovividus TaxID=387638 RepID=A0ABM7VBQ6_9BACT|nr:hypothetical protein PEPS_04380 [Persicobacter psychrovividus]
MSNWVEVMGYFAMGLAAFSFTFRNLVSLRKVNIFAAVIFIIYGILIHAWPIVGLNMFILCLNAYELYRYFHKEKISSIATS